MTEQGHTIMVKPTRNRNLALAKCIIEEKIFNNTLESYAATSKPALDCLGNTSTTSIFAQ